MQSLDAPTSPIAPSHGPGQIRLIRSHDGSASAAPGSEKGARLSKVIEPNRAGTWGQATPPVSSAVFEGPLGCALSAVRGCV